MRNRHPGRIFVRHPILQGAVMAAVLSITPALASTTPEQNDVPVLSGTYILTAAENCLPVNNELHDITGTMTFDPSSGKVKLVEYIAIGNPLSLEHGKATEFYANSSKTFTLGSTTLQAFYGKLESGIATYLSFIGVEGGGCAFQGSLLRQ
jgi:hypothetical protein